MDFVIWLCVAIFVVVLLWGIDRHLCLKDIEIDLKCQLGDLLVSRDTSLDEICRGCAQSRVLELKALIRKHFKL
jgi:hypothetical protein